MSSTKNSVPSKNQDFSYRSGMAESATITGKELRYYNAIKDNAVVQLFLVIRGPSTILHRMRIIIQ